MGHLGSLIFRALSVIHLSLCSKYTRPRVRTHRKNGKTPRATAKNTGGTPLSQLVCQPSKTRSRVPASLELGTVIQESIYISHWHWHETYFFNYFTLLPLALLLPPLIKGRRTGKTMQGIYGTTK